MCAVEEMKTDWYHTIIFLTVMPVIIFLWTVTVDLIAQISNNKYADLTGGTALRSRMVEQLLYLPYRMIKNIVYDLFVEQIRSCVQ